MIKTVIENEQNLIVEGCYIPFSWKRDFGKRYLAEIRYICLVMSENYIRNHFDDIKRYASAVERRLDDTDCTIETVLADNRNTLKLCKEYQVEYLLIDDEYDVSLAL